MSAERILHYAIGPWMHGIVSAAAEHRLVDAITAGAGDAAQIAGACGISERGARALCDGLEGLGLLRRGDGVLAPEPEAALLSDEAWLAFHRSRSLEPFVRAASQAALRRLGPDAPAVYDLLLGHRHDAAANVARLGELRGSLPAGGVAAIADVMLDDDRGGDAWALAFHAELVLFEGAPGLYRRCEWRDMLARAGFSDVISERIDALSLTLLYAR